MNKLLKLKKWLTMPEVARHLSTLFGEEVSEADVLRLGLDRRLPLTLIFLNSVYASPCIPVDYQDVEYEDVPSPFGTGTFRNPTGGAIYYAPSGEMLQLQDKVVVLRDGLYQLAGIGGEIHDIEQMYWDLVGVSREETTSLEGVFVVAGQGEHRKWFQLREKLHSKILGEVVSIPLPQIPPTTAVVVETSALLEFEKTLGESAPLQEKPLAPKARSGYLNVIGALLELVKTPREGRESDAAVIRELEANYSDKHGISKRNLETVFSEAKRSLQS
jgi:hypothetical protein